MRNRQASQCAVILTALPVEYQAVRSHITNLQEEVHPEGTIYERGTFTSPFLDWEVGLVETRMGTARAAIEAERAIDYFKPSTVLFIGIAGGLKDVQIGDVVAATKVYSYESGKAMITFQPRPEVGISTYRMIQRAQTVSRKKDWLQRIRTAPIGQHQAFVAPITAGEKVVASTRSSTWRFIKQYYGDALAVEMEGHGFLQAVHSNHHIEALLVRGISDLIDGKQNADASGSQEIAAYHASAFGFEVLARLTNDDFRGASQPYIGPKGNPRQPLDGPKNYANQHTHSGTIIAPIGDNSSVRINKYFEHESDEKK